MISTNKDNQEEMLPVVDESGNIISSATRGECHNGSHLLHPVVHLHVFNSRGDLCLQQRPMWKDIQPGKWDTAVGGHVDLGEDILTALRREAQEEIGFHLSGLAKTAEEAKDGLAFPVCHYVFNSERESELVYVHSTIFDGPLSPSDEVDGIRFWSKEDIAANLGKGVFTPNFEQEYIRCFGTID